MIVQNVLGNSAIVGMKIITWNKSNLVPPQDNYIINKKNWILNELQFSKLNYRFHTNLIDLFFFNSTVNTHFF